ncbi:hypothetical protein [Flavilitoribacter nigricans]|uniref:Uncharacterized protein n=1 Tax=Flavilitoribacter nigricans (strain ATCC 23147 / DSM 23189 / NBRC 102662 / NCIMB 1420 / SS-2) TaxID=1122177 RepID=A0A2D0NCR4_FLAN2|nr:hypothetical protein [Flavilitoribacter nigricans]PHN06301.1 hypothetical protein CRP01_12065 [Flavilitoribacter nigricans DSM 23189 = NBRC 102662]
MKKSTWIRLHLYCGLFTSFYLIAFGFSSLILNHQVELNHTEVTDTWDARIEVVGGKTDQELAEELRDQLSLMGWLPPWQYKRDSLQFSCVITHLAKDTQLELDLQSGAVQASEKPKGLLAVLHGLHFFNGRIPNAPFFCVPGSFTSGSLYSFFLSLCCWDYGFGSGTAIKPGSSTFSGGYSSFPVC